VARISQIAFLSLASSPLGRRERGFDLTSRKMDSTDLGFQQENVEGPAAGFAIQRLNEPANGPRYDQNLTASPAGPLWAGSAPTRVASGRTGIWGKAVAPLRGRAGQPSVLASWPSPLAAQLGLVADALGYWAPASTLPLKERYIFNMNELFFSA
jgi:hypothetical protein